MFSFDTSSVTGLDLSENLPEEFRLAQNYPNPFNPSTSINFQVPLATDVTLRVFNVLGQEVRTLINGFYAAGQYSVTWNGRDNLENPVPSGMYLYQLEADGFSEIRKMILVK